MKYYLTVNNSVMLNYTLCAASGIYADINTKKPTDNQLLHEGQQQKTTTIYRKDKIIL
jgi:hypothetical protein